MNYLSRQALIGALTSKPQELRLLEIFKAESGFVLRHMDLVVTNQKGLPRVWRSLDTLHQFIQQICNEIASPIKVTVSVAGGDLLS